MARKQNEGHPSATGGPLTEDGTGLAIKVLQRQLTVDEVEKLAEELADRLESTA